MRLDFEAARFNASLAIYLQEFKETAATEIGRLALDLLGRVKARTPVDTQRLKNSFHAVLPGQVDNYTYSDNKGRSFDGTLTSHRWAELSNAAVEAVVGSNVPYAIYLEAGHSRKAPTGMLAISVAELAGRMEAVVEIAAKRTF
jgi:hypothetical protein